MTTSSAGMFLMIGKIVVSELPDYANNYTKLENEGYDYSIGGNIIWNSKH
jgi:hypothetical protein